MPALDAVLEERLSSLQSAQQLRVPATVRREAYPLIWRGGDKLISFSCNDYLGLSQHPQVKEAAAEALHKHGAGAGASRLITGNHPFYDKVEEQLARLKKTEAACVFGNGYMANLGAITALVGKGDLIVADKLVHACILDAAQLSGATLRRFEHNDMAHLERVLMGQRTQHRHCLIITETVFSMDGDLAPLPSITALAERFNSWLMTDDAHGLGVVKQENAAHIQMGTLSKAVGAYGGYICGSQTLIDYLKSAARSLIYTTALPPATLAAASAALNIIRYEPELREVLMQKAARFAQAVGQPTPQSAIIPLIAGSSESALFASQTLADAGFWVHPIRPPTVPEGTARLRVAITALHDDADIDRLAATLKEKRLVRCYAEL